MAFDLPGDWVWDFWLAQEFGPQPTYHLFHLAAPKTLPPDLRHVHARVAHAVGPDLVDWTPVGDALRPSTGPAFDDLAIWTGSVVRDDAGTWLMFYSAIGRADGPRVQRIGLATSPDLYHWSRASRDPLVVADPRWYDGQAWRDPWVFRDPAGSGWHMFVTASAADCDRAQAGVVGHAWSPDLRHWEVGPPVTAPGCGFSELEVPQLVDVEGDPVLLASCRGPELSPKRRAEHGGGGTWALPGDSPVGPFDANRAVRLTDESLYVGKMVRQSGPKWAIMGFVNHDLAGSFVGGITSPRPLGLPLGRGPLVSADSGVGREGASA
ncbi:MAG: glycosyl hydrolase family 32 [Dermatophilaceae bacterium]